MLMLSPKLVVTLLVLLLVKKFRLFAILLIII